MRDLPTPNLRAALSRARRLGATVEHVRRKGEYRVISGGTRLTISNHRKDAPLRLTQLITDLEARAHEKPAERPARAAPPATPAATPTPAAPVTERPVTMGERVRRHIETTIPADPEGWRAWPGAHPIADELGLKPLQVSVFVSDATRRGEIETRKTREGRGGRIDMLRFARPVDATKQPGGIAVTHPELPKPKTPIGGIRPASAADYRDQPLRPVAVDPLSGPLRRTGELGQLAVPKLAAYATAHKAIHDVPFAKLDLTDADVTEILHDARRLFWYMKSGGKIASDE